MSTPNRYRPDRQERFSDVRVAIHPVWRIAGTTKPSSTRHYIGSVNRVDDIVAEKGAFQTQDEFYSYWRSAQRGWPVNPGVTKAKKAAAALAKATTPEPTRRKKS